MARKALGPSLSLQLILKTSLEPDLIDKIHQLSLATERSASQTMRYVLKKYINHELILANEPIEIPPSPQELIPKKVSSTNKKSDRISTIINPINSAEHSTQDLTDFQLNQEKSIIPEYKLNSDDSEKKSSDKTYAFSHDELSNLMINGGII